METKKGKKRKGEEIINKPFEKKQPYGWTKGGTRKKKEHKRRAVKSIRMVIIMLLAPNPLKIF